MMQQMLVIDAHAHAPRKGVSGVDERPFIGPRTEEERDLFMERDMNEMLAQMDLNGTQKCALIAMPEDIEESFHFGEPMQDTNIRTYTCHEWILRAVHLRPERFFGIACIDPLSPEAPERASSCAEQGFRGFKVHQAHGNFEVNDRRAYPFYEACAELGLPVLFHTGYSPLRGIDRFIPTNPILLDELANDLKQLQIVMCHCGGNWYQEGVMVALRNENIMLDTSGLRWLSQFMVWPEIDARVLIRRIVDIAGADRVMYGTDNDESCDPDYMRGCQLKEDDFRKVMGLNAKMLFHL